MGTPTKGSRGTQDRSPIVQLPFSEEDSRSPIVVRDRFRGNDVGSDLKRPFLMHLRELRARILRAFLWISLATGLSFRFTDRILGEFLKPVGQVVFLSPAEPFLVHLKTAFLTGIFLSIPLLAWEFWGFLRPAFRGREPKTVALLVPISTGLFFLGAWLGFKILLPVGLKFLLKFQSASLLPMITVGHYLEFAGWLVIGCGLAFQMPLAIAILTLGGWIHPGTLLRQWRIALVVILVVSAFLTPTPDVVTQLLLAVPMGLLYLVSVGLAYGVCPR